MRPHNVEVDAAAGVQSFTVPAGARYLTCSYCRPRNTVIVHMVVDWDSSAIEPWRMLIMREDDLAHVDAPGAWQFGCRWDTPMLSGQAHVEVATTTSKKRPSASQLTQQAQG